MRISALVLVISAIASGPGTLLTIRIDFKTKFVIFFLSALISGSVGIFCSFKGFGVWALVAQSSTQACVFTIATLILVRWFPRLTFSKASFNKLFSYSSKLLAASLISTVYSNAYNMVIGKKFSGRDVGLFSRAGQFPNVVNDVITGSFNRVAFPVLNDDQRLIQISEKFIQFFCFISTRKNISEKWTNRV